MTTLLVTGGCGFIGGNFVRHVLADEAVRVVNLDALTYAGNPANLAGLEKHTRYSFLKGDITDRECVRQAMRGVNAVIHFAAESHVDRSIQDSGPFVRTNVLGTQVLLDAAREFEVEKFVHVSCYDDRTRVLTVEGFKSYDQVRVGEEVFTINPDTGMVELKRVKRVIAQDYTGPMAVFRSNRIDLKVTPNHRMLFVWPKPEGACKVREAEARVVAERSAALLPRGGWAGPEDDVINIEGIGPVDSESLFYVAGVFIGDGLLSKQVAKRKNKTGLSRPEYLKRARGGNGRFVSGRFGTQETCECISYRIFFDVPESDKARSRLENSLTRLGINWTAHKGRAGEHVYFSSQPWSDFFAQFGRYAPNKHVPRWMLGHGVKLLRALLDGIADSDGHRPGGNAQPRIATCSLALVQDLCELGLKLGLMPRYSVRGPHETKLRSGRVIRPRHTHYMIFFRNEWIGIDKRFASTETYHGVIWCLQVEDNRNLVAERNGILAFSGNTDEVYGSLGPTGYFTETTPLSPNSPYSASKAGSDLLVQAYHHTFGLPAVITRCSNNYGPYQFPEKLIPLFICNLMAGESVPVYGDGRQVRDWIHVRDHCAAIEAVWRKGRPGEVYNVGGRSERANLDLTHRLLDLLGKPRSLIRHVTDRLGHDRRYAIDSSKIENELGWRPAVSFEDGLRETVRWYQENQEWVRRVRSGEYRAR